jgi:FMN phosphatase YigB (HAD superfamily)
LECKLAPSWWGQGYASEALDCMIDFLFQHTTVSHLSVTPHPANDAACRLYRRRGFRPAPAPDALECSDCDYWVLPRPGNPPSPHALIFDWGGVLMRTRDDSGRRDWERLLRLPPRGADRAVFESRAWHNAQLGRLPAEAAWRTIGDSLGLGDADLARFRRDFWSGDQLNEALLTRIIDWRAAGHPVALLSNFSAELTEFLDAHQVRHVFDPIIVSAHEGIMKPAAWLYWRTLNRIGINPAEALFVDDATQNIDGAQRVGMHTIYFRDTAQAIEEIERILL